MITYIKKDQPQYKANLHCHSTVSDGKLTPAELKDAYARLTAMLAHLREADRLRYYNILAQMLIYN